MWAPEITYFNANDLALLERELLTRKYAVLLIEGGGAYPAGQVARTMRVGRDTGPAA